MKNFNFLNGSGLFHRQSRFNSRDWFNYQGLFYRRGLSFIEVMYSVVLLAGTLVLLSHISEKSSLQLNKSKRYLLISQLMENKLTQLELEYQKEGDKVLEEVEMEKFEDHPDLFYSLTSQKAKIIHPSELLEDIAENPIYSTVKQIETELLELVTEVHLTIHYKKNKKTTDYSITSYFIDFKTLNKSLKDRNLLSKFLPKLQ